MKLEILNEEDYLLWDKFLDEGNYVGKIFNKSNYLGTLGSVLKLKLTILVVKRNEEVVSGIAFLNHKSRIVNLKSQYTLNSLLPYNHIFYKPSESIYNSKKESHFFSVVQPIIDFMTKEFDFVNYRCSWQFNDVRPFIWNGFEQKINYTYVSNLTNFDFSSINKPLKRWIKKGLDVDINISSEANEKDFNSSYDLLKRTYVRHKNVIPLSRNQFKKYIYNNIDRGNLSMFVTYYEEVPVSNLVVVYDYKTVYSILHGNNPDYYNWGIGSALIYKIIRNLKEEGYEKFDFMGLDGEVLAKYKSGFNFDMLPFYEVSKASKKKKLLRLLKNERN